MTVSMNIPSARLRRRAPLSAARLRRSRLRRAAIWGHVAWGAFIVGSAALALGLAGFVNDIPVAGIVSLAVWVGAYGMVLYSIRAHAMARGDKTLQEHVARVKRSRYERSYPHAVAITPTADGRPGAYRPEPSLLSPGLG